MASGGKAPIRFVATLFFVFCLSIGSANCADVVINPGQTYQTIVGWGDGGGVYGDITGGLVDPATAAIIDKQCLDCYADDLGLTGSRTWEVGPRIDGTGIDTVVQVNGETVGNCDLVDWNLFESDTFPQNISNNLLYFQNKVLAQGYQPSFYSSPTYPTSATMYKPWVLNHPGERALQIWANALYLKEVFGININYAVIQNEPSAPWTVAFLSDDIKAVGPRLAAQGLSTLVQYAEGVAPQTDWSLITPVLDDPTMWPFVGRLSYHNYGTADPYRSFLRDFGLAKGLTTAQTEMGDPSFDDLYADLTLAGVSYWEVAYSGELAANPGLTAFTPASKFFRLRQLMHYVRPGATRIGGFSSDPTIHVLAFSQNGLITTIIENTASAANTVNLYGLPPGTYGLSSSAGSPFLELGLQTVGADGKLTLANVAGGSTATTLYPYSGVLPPTITTWGANPGYLVSPAATTTLSVTANDAQLYTLHYTWSVTSQPAGANALLSAPSAASTNANGLTVPGTYVFNIVVDDAQGHTAAKEIYLIVYASNPPPVLGSAGFRFASPYGLVFSPAGTMTHAIVEEPTSSATLQCGISSIANASSYSGVWSVVSQPAGANVSLSATTYIFVSLRSNLSGMTVPGDYLFQLDVPGPGQPGDQTVQIKCTVTAASSGPVINSATPGAASLTLPASSTQLTAVTTDPAGQLLRHWWEVTTVPAGANPVFDTQGLPVTNVSGLTLPGNYTFTLRAFDDIHMATQNVTIAVNPAPGAPVINSAAAETCIFGTPFTPYTITATNNPASFGATNLPPGLTFNNGVISGTPQKPGLWDIGLSSGNADGTGYGNLALTVNFPAPVITSPLNTDGLVNAAFNYTINATNVPTSYTATGLPAGLTLNSNGANLNLISGTPTAVGTTSVTITATNASGTATETLVIQIYSAAPAAPAITNNPLTASGTVGVPFNYTITANGTPTNFLAIGLPAGLSFNQANGVVSGIPYVSGTFNVALEASNCGGTGAQSTLALTIAPAAGACVISGSITSGGAGLSGVSVSDGASSAITDGSGNYSITNVSNGAYTLTPSLAGYNFSPASLEVTASGTNITGQNFTATISTFSVSGMVTYSGNPLAGVNVGDGTSSATTDNFGYYTIANVPNGTYTLTPALAGYTFTPATLSVTGAGTNITGQNFTANPAEAGTYTISGTITSGGTGVAGVVVSDGTSSATTNASGNYTIANVPNGPCTLTPALAGYTFSPATQEFTVNGANVSQDFTATPAGTQVATPTFSPGGGTYASAQSVTISCATNGATIYYTTDGSTPTTASTVYTGPINIATSTQLQALAVVVGMTNSLVPSEVYHIAGSNTFVSDTYTDTDGNGFPDEIISALGLFPSYPTLTPFGIPAVTAPLTLSKLEVKLNFTHTGGDAISLSGALQIPAGLVVSGQSVLIDVGGVIKIFTLDIKGNGHAASGYPALTSPTNDRFKLHIKLTKEKVLKQNAPFTAQFNKGTFGNLLSDEGLLGTATVKKAKRTVPVVILFNVQIFEASPAVLYSAKAQKTGTASFSASGKN
jgi:hypothetical protein